MSQSRFYVNTHEKERHNAIALIPVRIDGSALTTTSSAAGVVEGKNILDASDDGSNTVTLTFKEPLKNIPTVTASVVGATTTLVKFTTISASQIVYDTVQADGTTAQADADVHLHISVVLGSTVV